MAHVIVEAAFGYGLFTPSPVLTDISRYVDLLRGIDITRGAQNELQETQPSTCTLVLDNSDGRFTADRPTGPYYPHVKLGTIVRVSVATFTPRTEAAPYPLAMLSDDFDDDRISPTLWPNSYGGVTAADGRARIPMIPDGFAALQSAREWVLPGSTLTARLSTVPAAGGSSAAAVGMYLNSTVDGTRLGWRYNAVTGQISAENQTGYFDSGAVSFTYSPYLYLWLRIRESAGTVYWESSADGATWTVRRSLATPAWASSETLIVEFATSRTGGTGDYAEVSWIGATVHPRFFGLASGWPVEWQGLTSTATLTCTDLLTYVALAKQLQPMYVQEVLLDRPTAYYPLTEASDSTSAGDLSGTPGTASLAVTQAGAGGALDFAAGTGPNGLPCPTFTPASASAGKYLTADLGQNFVDANALWRVRCDLWFSTSTTGRVLMALASTDTSVKMIILLESGTGKLAVEKDQLGNGVTTTVFATPNLADGALHYLLYNEVANEIVVDGTAYTAASSNGTDLRTLSVGGYAGQRLWAGQIAHVACYIRSATTAELSGHYTTGTTAHVGEAADDRLNRIASYVGLSVTTQGSTFDAMGSQAELGSSALEHLRQIETTESGKLLANRTTGPLLFQSRDLRYNPTAALTLDYADLETRDVRYAYDDQKMVNDVTASRPGGATQRVTDQTSVTAYGIKAKAVELYKDNDNSVTDAANWLVSRYANPVAEIRQVPVEAYSLPVATYRALLAADVSTALAVTGLPTQAPAATVALFIEGYTEHIALSQHRLDFYTSRAETDTVWILDDPVYSVLGSTTRLAY